MWPVDGREKGGNLSPRRIRALAMRAPEAHGIPTMKKVTTHSERSPIQGDYFTWVSPR
jgi:hypothetical protein